ncbi:MAG: OmpA family protein [Alphaproteobacteria bacterium]
MTLKNIMLAGAAALALTGAAAADTPAGFYLDLGAGGNWLQDFESQDFDTGYYVGGTAGYKLDNGLKFEFEVAYRSNDFDFVFGQTALFRGTGTVTSFSLMGNMLYDIDLGPGYSLSLGGGVGTARIGFDAAPFLDDRDWVFAFQGLAELEAMVSDDVGIFAGYNYFEANNAFDDSDGFDYKAHTALVGVRFHFIEAEAPPPPPPPPPPVAAKTFIVFFNFDKSDLTPEAQAVVAEAAAAFKSTGSVSIAVVGHTDTVGSAAYNLPLSERRAASVKAGLVANGVPGDVISTSGKGFSEPLVPTGPGVKEPQNRRATIDLTGSAM